MRHLMAAAACKAIIAVREAFTHAYTAYTDDKKRKINIRLSQASLQRRANGLRNDEVYSSQNIQTLN